MLGCIVALAASGLWLLKRGIGRRSGQRRGVPFGMVSNDTSRARHVLHNMFLPLGRP